MAAAEAPSSECGSMLGLTPLQEHNGSSGGGTGESGEELRCRLTMARHWSEDLCASLQRVVKDELQDIARLVQSQVRSDIHSELQSFQEGVTEQLEAWAGTSRKAAAIGASTPPPIENEVPGAVASCSASSSIAPPVARKRHSLHTFWDTGHGDKELAGEQPEPALPLRASQYKVAKRCSGASSSAMDENEGPHALRSCKVATRCSGASSSSMDKHEGPHALRSCKVKKVLAQARHPGLAIASREDSIEAKNFSAVHPDPSSSHAADAGGGAPSGEVEETRDPSSPKVGFPRGDNKEDDDHGEGSDGRRNMTVRVTQAMTYVTTHFNDGMDQMHKHTPRRCIRLYQIALLIVTSPIFDATTGGLVFLNSLSIGIQTDYIAREGKETLPIGFRVVELVFCAMFTAELALRLFVYRFRFFYMPGWRWNVFDFFVVLMQLFEEACQSLDNAVDLQAMRVLRVLRLIRVVRFIRVIHLIGELRTLATSILSSLKSLMWTVVMLMLLMFIVGVTLTQVVSDYRIDAHMPDEDLLKPLYGSVLRSILTLYQSNTGGIDWANAVDPLVDNISPMLAPVFSMYIAFVVLAIMNVVTGVFVESALKSAKDDKETVIVNHMRELFEAAAGHEMTWSEFEGQLDNPRMQDYFQTIDVDSSEAEIVFKLLDVDGNGAVSEDEFLGGCLKLTGPAKALDLAILSNEVRAIAHCIEGHLVEVENLLASLGEDKAAPQDARPSSPFELQ